MKLINNFSNKANQTKPITRHYQTKPMIVLKKPTKPKHFPANQNIFIPTLGQLFGAIGSGVLAGKLGRKVRHDLYIIDGVL